MFKWELKENFEFFVENENGLKYPTDCWDDIREQYLSQFSILNELVDNGFAVATKHHCKVDVIEVLNLNNIDKQVLFLPTDYPYEILIQSNGQLNQKTFKFKYGFYDFFPHGNKLNVKRNKPLVEIEGRIYLLSLNQYLVCEALDSFNSLPDDSKTFHSNLTDFAGIKSISTEAACILEPYLSGENVINPDKIRIDLDFNNGQLELIPFVNEESKSTFVKTFDKFPLVNDVYNVQSTSGTTRFVIEEKHRTELQKIKTIRRVSDNDTINKLIEHPESFFDEEAVDLSVFYSDRVKEIGVYKPKFYPFVCPYKSEWIPGIAVKDKILGEKRIHFKTEQELSEFERKTIAAQKDGQINVIWNDTEIPFDDAENFINIARKQFKQKHTPIANEDNNSSNEVLIIKENAEILEYVATGTFPQVLQHRYKQIDNLNQNITLKEHQIEGIAWLQSLLDENLSGCLLADDMGLGKTLQLLYFIEWHAQSNNENKPYLVVAPVSLLENWENEYEKFFTPKSLTVEKLHGKVNLSKEFNEPINRNDAARLQHKQLILTNYETLREYQATMCLVDFAVVVLDEAQKIKTPGTLVTNVSKALKADFKIAMTGTPVENTLVDLWCIMDFSVPGLLGNAKDFAKEYQNPLKDQMTNIIELGESLRRKIGIFIKRRLKKDVAKELPLKIIHNNSQFKRVMPKVQFERYKVELQLAANSELEGIERRNQILKSLWAIRDIADHPYLVDRQISNSSTDELLATSAKLQIVKDILDGIKVKGDKVIIFADRKETQKLLQKIVCDIYNMYPSIVNGDTPTTKKSENSIKLSRQQTIDRFQDVEGFNVIIMSQLAAGVGLNVTKANHVIHYTRHWNPAKESQATDRVYRIGQTKEVYVYYPMAVLPEEFKDEEGNNIKSFDEILDHLLDLKTTLSTSTLFPTEQAEIKPEEIFSNVFNIKNLNANPTQITLEQADQLHPNLFEAAIAALYNAMNFKVILTPFANDKGADVVAIGKNECVLIQAKQSKSKIGIEAVQEIYGAKNYYESIFGESFNLVIITNSYYSPSALNLSESNNVHLINRERFNELLNSHYVTISDVYNFEHQRKQSI